MKLSGDDYIDAASERVSSARLMYEAARFPDAMYLAGVAVECVLRAFASEASDELDARHDLARLMHASNLQGFVGEKQRETLSAALGEVWAR